jgi:serine/threonine protein kinase
MDIKFKHFFDNLPKNIPRFRLEDKLPTDLQDLQSGTYGKTVLSKTKAIVVKIIRFQKNMDEFTIDRTIHSLHNEIINYHAISTLCPKYFCKFLGYYFDPTSMEVYIKMENCGKDLLEFHNDIEDDFTTRLEKYRKDESLSIYQFRDAVDKLELDIIKMKKIIFLKILEAMKCIHDNGYVHLDLKPENIVVYNNANDVKFVDAGSLTKIRPGTKVHVFGTKEYMAPELYKTKLVDNNEGLKMLDVYSFGKMSEYMLTPKELISVFGSDKIVSMCIDPNPQKRPKASTILININPMLVFQSKTLSSSNRKSSKTLKNSSNKKTLR